MDIYTIYKATNKVNGKSYIGYDSNYPKRKSDHKNIFATGNEVFYRALRKYGWDNFDWEILYQSKESLHTKNIMENFFIVEYNTHIHFENSQGYNMTLGGDGVLGNKKSKSAKEKFKQTCLEKYGYEHFSSLPEIKEKKKETSLENWGYEYTLQSPEVREKSRQTCLEKYGVDNAAKQKVNCRFCGKFLGINHETFCEKNPDRVVPYDRTGENNPRYGAKLTEETKEKQRKMKCKYTYSLITPTEEIINTDNLAKFCEEYCLDVRNLSRNKNGVFCRHKGFRILSKETK